jgi:hypothetical protein
MPLNVLGGALEFEAEIDLGTFEEQIKRMENLVAGIAEKAIAAGKSQADAISEIIKAINPNGSPAIEATIAKIKELQVEEQKILELMEKTKDPTLLNEYEQSIQKVHDLLDKAEGTLNDQVEQEIINNVRAVTQGLDLSTQANVRATAQLAAIKSELANTDKNDPRYQQLLADATELKERIAGVNKELKQSTESTAGISSLGQGVRGLLGSFEALSGVMSIFGENSEQVQKSTRDVIAVMGILNGIEEVGKVLAKDSALNTFLLAQNRKFAAAGAAQQAVATEALVVAEGEQAVATEAAAVAQTELNVAMAANPAGILLLAIGAIIAAIQIFANSSEDAAEKQHEVNDAMLEAEGLMQELAELYNQHYRDLTKNAEFALELAQAQGKSEEEIFQFRKKALDAKRQETISLLSNNGINALTLEGYKKQTKALEDQLAFHKEILHAKLASLSKDDEGIQKLKDQIALDEKRFSIAAQGLETLTKTDEDQQKLAAEKAAKAREDSFKSETARAETRLTQAKKNTEEELKFQVLAIQAKTKQELADVNLTVGERGRIRAQEQKEIEAANKKYRLFLLNAGKEEMQARLAQVKDGSAEELDLRKGIINQTAAIELEQEGISQERKKRIRAEEVKALSELYKKFGLESAANEINTAIAISQQRLDVVKEGTTEELNLKQILIQQKAALDINSAISQIKNEKLLVEKIGEINSKSVADQKKLDNDFTEFQLKNIFKVNEQQRILANSKLEGVLGDPTATNSQKNNAQLKILENSRKETINNIFQVELSITRNAGDINKLLEQRIALYNSLLDLENRINNQNKKNEQDRINSLIETGKAVADTFERLSEFTDLFSSDLSEAIKKMAQLGKNAFEVGKAIQAYKKASEKDPVTGKTDTLGQISAVNSIVSLVVGVVESIAKGIKKSKQDKKDTEEAVNLFNNSLLQGEIEYQKQLRERARIQILNNKLTLDGLKAQKQLIDQQKSANAQTFNDVLKQLQGETFVSGIKKNKNSTAENIFKSLLGNPDEAFKELRESLAGKNFDQLEELFNKGQLTGKAKELFETLQKIKAEGADLDQLLEENKKKAEEIFTGTTAESILDSITEGFSHGLHSAADFADTFEDLMRGAVINSLKFKFLEGPLHDLFEEFASATESGDQLTSGEIANLKAQFDGIIKNADQQFQQLQQIAGINLGGSNQQNALSGAIKGITEQTAELLAGQFGGLRITAIDQLTLSRQALTVQQSIENNTALTATKMQRLLDKFDAYEVGTKKISVQ